MQCTVTRWGQTTLPSELRRLLRLQLGDRVAFVVHADGQVLVRKASAPSVAVLRGLLPKPAKALTVEAMHEAIAQADHAVRTGQG